MEEAYANKLEALKQLDEVHRQRRRREKRVKKHHAHHHDEPLPELQVHGHHSEHQGHHHSEHRGHHHSEHHGHHSEHLGHHGEHHGHHGHHSEHHGHHSEHREHHSHHGHHDHEGHQHHGKHHNRKSSDENLFDDDDALRRLETSMYGPLRDLHGHRSRQRHGGGQLRKHRRMTPPTPPDLDKFHSPAYYHYGQQFSRDYHRRIAFRTQPYGFERLLKLYEHDVAYRFEQFQHRQPMDFLLDTEWRLTQYSRDKYRPPKLPDGTRLDRRMWFSPYRKGQKYFDYCRDKWMEKESRIGAALGSIASVYSMWTITDNILNHGGFIFMLMYLLLTLTFVVPFIYMELVIGQNFGCGPIRTLYQACPLFRGVAYLMLVWCFFDYLLSMTRLSWMVYYVLAMFRQIYPWKHCDKHWTTLLCKDPHESHELALRFGEMERTPVVEFFRGRVLRFWKSDWADLVGILEPFHFFWNDVTTRKTNDFDNPNKDLNGIERYSLGEPGYFPNLDLLICFLLLAYIVRSSMKLTCTALGRRLLIGFTIAFFFTGSCLIGRTYSVDKDTRYAAMEWFFDIRQHSHHLVSSEAWRAAVRQAIIASGIGCGFFITAGSQNNWPNDEIKTAAVLSGFTSYLVHYLVGVYLMICHFVVRRSPAYSLNPKAYGNDTFFDIFPLAVTYHTKEGYAWFHFNFIFLGIIIFSISRVICALHTIKIAFCDENKEFYDPARVAYNPNAFRRAEFQERLGFYLLSGERKAELITRFMAFAGIFHVFTFFRGGFLYMYFAEAMWYNYMPGLIVYLEGLAIFFFLGGRKLSYYIRLMTTFQASFWFRLTWKLFCPLVPLAYIVNLDIPHSTVEFDGIPFNENCYKVGYIVCGLFPGLLLLNILFLWLTSPAKGCLGKFIYEVSPIEEHERMVRGLIPSTRLNWIQQQHVVDGIHRGEEHEEGVEPPSLRIHCPSLDRFVVEFLWYGCCIYKLQRMTINFFKEYISDNSSIESDEIYSGDTISGEEAGGAGKLSDSEEGKIAKGKAKVKKKVKKRAKTSVKKGVKTAVKPEVKREGYIEILS